MLSEAVQKANSAVADQIPEGGTTVTSAAVLSDRVYIAHVGDSRAYLISSEGIEQITRHHLIRELRKRGVQILTKAKVTLIAPEVAWATGSKHLKAL